MASTPKETTPSRHGRNPGSRGALPRRSTRGPLDISQAPVSESTSPASSDIISPPLLPSAQSGSASPVVNAVSSTSKNFSKLLRPEIFHPLTQLDIPPPFRSSVKQPSPEMPLETLLNAGHFRAAAISAANKLTLSTAPSDDKVIFELWYIRLVCLTLCGSTALAAQEVKALEDLNSSVYQDELSGAHLVPWELRVLAVRLQGMGFNDPRKGVMGYYDMAREARDQILKLKETQSLDDRERKDWERRLDDLGVRVASALVEMEDLSGAAHHLSTLKRSGSERIILTMALLWLKVGDSKAAEKCVEGSVDGAALVSALSSMADGDYETAVENWRGLCERDASNEMYAQNLAVSLLYSGRMDEARDMLERLIDGGKSFGTLTFNLCTIYELCTDRSHTLKVKLAERVAALPGNDGSGWEKTNADFKL